MDGSGYELVEGVVCGVGPRCEVCGPLTGVESEGGRREVDAVRVRVDSATRLS